VNRGQGLFRRITETWNSTWFRLPLGLLILVWIFRRFHLTSAVFHLPPHPVWTAALFLLPLNLWFQYQRWRTLVLSVDREIPHSLLFASFLEGISAGLLTPGSFGEHLRVVKLGEGRRTALLTTSVLDKFLGGTVTSLAGLAASVVLILQRRPAGTGWYLGLCGAGLLFYLLLLFLVLRGPLRRRFLRKLRLERFALLQRVEETLRNLSAGDLFRALFRAALFYATFMLQFLLIMWSITGHTVWSIFPQLAAMMFLKGRVPISWGDLGVRELLTTWLLAGRGIDQAQAVQGSLLLFAMNILLPALLGVLVFMLRRRH